MAEMKLADAITKLRDELREAQARHVGDGIQFTVGEISLELSLILKDEVGGAAGVKAWFVEVGASAKRAHEHTHKITLRLTPSDKNGRPIMASDSETHEE